MCNVDYSLLDCQDDLAKVSSKLDYIIERIERGDMNIDQIRTRLRLMRLDLNPAMKYVNYKVNRNTDRLAEIISETKEAVPV